MRPRPGCDREKDPSRPTVRAGLAEEGKGRLVSSPGPMVTLWATDDGRERRLWVSRVTLGFGPSLGWSHEVGWGTRTALRRRRAKESGSDDGFWVSLQTSGVCV